MSSFRQLMMKRFHSAKNYMDLTVVGSPTISSGVVSGFSSSNYLQISGFSNSIQNNNFEMVFKASCGQYTDGKHILFTFNTGSNTTIAFINNRLWVLWNNASIGTSSLNFTNQNFVVGQYYFIKFKRVGNIASLSWGTDGVNFPNELTQDIGTVSLVNGVFQFGYNAYITSNGYSGSVDISASYIKIGTTKYEFRFALPLTVVGSPTITDGVVSGFSSSDYLQTGAILPTDTGHQYVFEGQITTPANANSSRYIFSFYCNNAVGGAVFGFMCRSTSKFAVVTTNGQLNGSTIYEGSSYQFNTIYKYRIETDLNTYVRLYIDDNLEMSQSLSYSGIKSYNGIVYLGAYADNKGNPLNSGSIDVGNSYIIIDGTKYILTLP